MKKKITWFIVLLIVGIIVFFLGFIRFAVSSIPFQDPQYVPDSVIVKQMATIFVGKLVMLLGAAMSLGSIAGIVILGKKKEQA